MPKTVPAELALDASVRPLSTHPLLRYARDIHIVPGSLIRYHPVPEWAAIPGPYDAILQFRERFAARVAARNSGSRRTYDFDYAPELISDESRRLVAERAPTVRYPVYTRTGIAMVDLEFEPVQLRFALGPNRLSFGDAGSTEARLEWTLAATIVYRETADSLAARRGPEFRGFSTPLPEAEVREVEVDTATLRTVGVLRLDTSGGRYHVRAYVDVTDSVFALAAVSPLAADHFGRLVERIQPGFGHVPVTPTVVLPGYQGGRQVDVDLGAMHAYMVLTHGNSPGEKVLHLCLSFGDPVPDRHLAAVRPFCADLDYAYHQSDRLTLAILRRRWSTLPAEERTTVLEIDLPLLRDGRSVTGRGSIRVRIGDLAETELETTPEQPDFVKAIAASEMELLEASDETGAELDVDSLGVVPESADHIGIAYFPFASPPPDLPPVNRFIDRLLTRLLRQMYTPFHYTEPYRISGIEGHVSQPIGAIFLRANLEA